MVFVEGRVRPVRLRGPREVARLAAELAENEDRRVGSGVLREDLVRPFQRPHRLLRAARALCLRRRHEQSGEGVGTGRRAGLGLAQRLQRRTEAGLDVVPQLPVEGRERRPQRPFHDFRRLQSVAIPGEHGENGVETARRLDHLAQE